jgi:hypothetical protein
MGISQYVHNIIVHILSDLCRVPPPHLFITYTDYYIPVYKLYFHSKIGHLLPVCQEHYTDNMAAAAPYVEVNNAELMAAPEMDGGAPAEGSASTDGQRDEAEDGGQDFVWGGQEKTPTCAPW